MSPKKTNLGRQPKRLADAWLTEISLLFTDGKKEEFSIEWTKSGSHIPKESPDSPADWTRLEFHKCPGCPLGKDTKFCPAAESLETTIMKLKKRSATEKVIATAIDGAKGRRTVVECELKEVGSTLVQISVFFGGCPIGKKFKKLLKNLRPFATNEELSKHLISQFLLKNGCEMATSTVDVRATIEPMRTVFYHLSKRISDKTYGDVIANSILQMDAFTLSISLYLGEIYEELAKEFEWKELGNKPDGVERATGIEKKVGSLKESSESLIDRIMKLIKNTNT